MKKIVESLVVGDKSINVALLEGDKWSISWVQVDSMKPYPACRGSSFDTKEAAIDAAIRDVRLVFGIQDGMG